MNARGDERPLLDAKRERAKLEIRPFDRGMRVDRQETALHPLKTLASLSTDCLERPLAPKAHSPSHLARPSQTIFRRLRQQYWNAADSFQKRRDRPDAVWLTQQVVERQFGSEGAPVHKPQQKRGGQVLTAPYGLA
jgi:hypothetical protein